MGCHMTADPVALVVRYVAALIDGDRARAAACLSPSFGRHEGRRAEEHLAHELSQFALLSRVYGVSSGWSVRPRGVAGSPPGQFGFLLETPDGRLIYEDALPIGEDGLLGGDGSAFETVCKLRLRPKGAGVDIGRGVAIRRAPHAPEAVIVRRPHTLDQRFHPRAPDPDYAALDFTVAGDIGATLAAEVLIYAAEGVREVKRLVLRGIDHPHFEGRAFVRIEGERVVVPKTRARPWSLCALLADGRCQTVLQPDSGGIQFDDRVVSAVLTDAVDNDWETIGDGDGDA